MSITLARTERLLKSPRGLVLLWVVATVALAVTALLMRWAGVPGWDDPAHLYKVFLIRNGDSIFWDDFWYGGSYGAVTYGFVFYWLAQWVPAKLIVVLAGGAIPVLFHLYQRDMWKIDDIWPSWLFVVTMAFYLAHGQDPFVLALALTLGGMALLARGRPLLAVVPVAVGIFTNPMALVVCAILMVADLLARPGTRRRYLAFFALLAPFALLRLLVGIAFAEPGSYLNETSQLMLYLGFALAGVALAGVNAAHPRRPFVILFATYAFVCVASFVTPGSPLGNNIGRFFMVFGLALLVLLRHSRLRRPFPYGDLVVIPIVLFGLLQISSPYSHFTKPEERPQTRATYFAPALQAARQLYDPDYRLHVVALRRHWESYYFPQAGYPITRGWYRQADAIHNELFYERYDAAAYVMWLRSMGVEYIFVAEALPDHWSRLEAAMLRSSPAFAEVEKTGAWTIYQLLVAEPIVVGRGGGTAHVRRFGHLALDISVDQAGEYLVKVSWSPYWTLGGAEGTITEGPGRMILLQAARPGTFTLRFEVTPDAVVDQVLAAAGL